MSAAAPAQQLHPQPKSALRAQDCASVSSQASSLTGQVTPAEPQVSHHHISHGNGLLRCSSCGKTRARLHRILTSSICTWPTTGMTKEREANRYRNPPRGLAYSQTLCPHCRSELDHEHRETCPSTLWDSFLCKASHHLPVVFAIMSLGGREAQS